MKYHQICAHIRAELFLNRDLHTFLSSLSDDEGVIIGGVSRIVNLPEGVRLQFDSDRMKKETNENNHLLDMKDNDADGDKFEEKPGVLIIRRFILS